MSDLLILGASGDLTGRYLLPALVALAAADRLPVGRIVGIARSDFDTCSFRQEATARLARHAPDAPASAVRAVLDRLHYRRGNASSANDLATAIGSEPIVAYLALPPTLFRPTIEALAAAPTPAGSRVVVEKPFGEDLASARALNDLLHAAFPENLVFRIDHFLGMQTVQNILALRFANRMFEPLWNNHHIDQVEIIWDETLALEGRAEYYDHAGALRDMIQNHLLQLLALVAMEPPTRLDEQNLRDRKIEVLRAVGRLSTHEVVRRTVRARYTAGTISGRLVPDYCDENGVDPTRNTETFAAVELRVDNWRWAGVPFLLRTSKALDRDRQEIRIYFKPVPHLAFPSVEYSGPNVLTLSLVPDRVALEISVTNSQRALHLDRARLAFDLAPPSLPAYARLLINVLEGDPTFTVRDDEAEESWAIVEPILQAWDAGMIPLRTYPAGSQGPLTR